MLCLSFADIPHRNRTRPRAFLLAAALVAAASLPAAALQVDAVTLCERTGCDGSDIRFQSTDPTSISDVAADFGFSMAMGYVDGDAFADLVVGAPEDGRVYVFYGGIDNNSPAQGDNNRELTATDPAEADLVLTSTDVQFGFSVAIGQGAGPNPILIGAPRSGTSQPGAAFVVPAAYLASSPTGQVAVTPANVPGLVSILGAQTGDEAGYSVALGPVLTAGSDDFVVGARVHDEGSLTDAGAVYVIGSTSNATVDLANPAGVTVRTVFGAMADEGLGEFLAVGDFDNDLGTWELAIGAVGTIADDQQNIPGHVYVLDIGGSDIQLSGFPGRRIAGQFANDFFGFSLAAGQFDGFGGPDLAIGAIYYDRNDSECATVEKNAGAVYLFDGATLDNILTAPAAGAPTPATDAAKRYIGFRKWDEAGFALAAGDVNDDGATDLVFSARRHDRSYTNVDEVDEGAVYVVRGPISSTPPDVCLDCPAGVCASGSLPAGVDAMLFGGDYNGSSGGSDEIGFSLAVGDFNGDSMFGDVAASSVTRERAYLVSLESTDGDAFRDIRDRDDDGDGYLDTSEDANEDGSVGPGESDPLVPNRDVTVVVTPATNAFDCDQTLTVTVSVRNAGTVALTDPELAVTLPQVLQPASSRSLLVYDPGSTTLGGAPLTDLTQKVCQNDPALNCSVDGDCAGVGGACSAFPFLNFRSVSGIAGGAQVDVQFRLRAVLPLEATAPAGGDIRADVQLDPIVDPNELVYPHDGGISQPNDDTATVTLNRPTLTVTKTSTDVDGGDLDPEDVIRYSITVENAAGASKTATGIVLVDSIPANTTYVADTITQDSAARTDAADGDNADFGASNAGAVTVTIASLAAGAQTTVTFDVTVNDTVADGDTVVNQAIASEDCLEDTASNTTSDTVTVTPGIDVEKSTNGLDADAAPGPYVLTAGSVTWGYVVTNTGNVKVNQVAVVDDVEGSVLCPMNSLNAGETMTCTSKVSAATAGQYVNTATVTGKTPGNVDVTDADPSHYFGATTVIDIQKSTNGQDADTAPGVFILVGDPVTWSYQVTNTGNVDLDPVTVTDDQGVTVSCPQTALAPAATMTCTASGTAATGQYGNLGTATGTPPGGLPDVQATDPSNYFGSTPAITLEKSTNGQDADTAPGPTILFGDPVSWAYLVTNTGNVDLDPVTVTDDQGVTVSCPQTTLAPAASMTCTASGTAVAGQYTNLGTATGTPPGGLANVQATDPSNYFGEAPGIDIQKSTNGQDADTAPGVFVLVGDPVSWEYVVTNTGNARLVSITVTDDQGVTVSCPQSALDPAEFMTCTASGTAAAGQYTNVGTADANSTGGGTAMDSDPSNYFGSTPAITLQKSTNGQDADVAPGPLVAVGDTVNWSYLVTNTGNVDLTVAVTDDQGVTVTCPQPTLAPSAAMTCTGSGAATTGQYTNLGTATGTPPGGLADVQATDPSNYFGVNPAIGIEKSTNGQDADVAPGPTILIGDPVNWEYVVTNTGDVDLTNVTVTDDQGVTVTCPQTTLIPAESMTCTGAGTAVGGQYANLGTAVGTPPGGLADVQATDPSHYLGPLPAIGIEKATNGQDADAAPGVFVLVGDPVNWTYLVTNTGNVDLTSVTVTDDQGVTVSCPQTTLAPAESMTCTANGTAVAGQYSNVGTATGTPPLALPNVQATDPSNYFGSTPAITIEKSTNGQDADVAPGPTITIGAAVNWDYLVTNTGNVDLSAVTVTDDQGVAVTCPQTTLAPAEAMTCTGSGTAVAGQYTNIGTATGTPPGGLADVQATDPSNYNGAPAPQPSVGEPTINWSDPDLLQWNTLSGATSYHVYRGDMDELRASGIYTQDPGTVTDSSRSCWQPGNDHTDSFVPQPGKVAFYLVTADDGTTEGSLGKDATGASRPNDNPCR